MVEKSRSRRVTFSPKPEKAGEVVVGRKIPDGFRYLENKDNPTRQH